MFDINEKMNGYEEYNVYNDLNSPNNPNSPHYYGGTGAYNDYYGANRTGGAELFPGAGKKDGASERQRKGLLGRMFDSIAENTVNTKEALRKRFLIGGILGFILGMYIFQPMLSLFDTTVEKKIGPISVLINYIMHNPIILLLIFFLDAIICVFIYKYMIDNKMIDESDGYTLSDNNTFGKAHKASKEELDNVLRFEDKEDPEGFILGLSKDDEAVTCPYGTPDKNSYNVKRSGNIMVFGATGSGKTYCFVKPNILARIANGQSYVVTDPSGELYRDTSKLAREFGYNVRVLNLLDFSASDGWNPFASLDANDPNAITDLTTLVSSFMKNTSDPKTKNDYFYNNEENLFKCLAAYAALSKNFKGEDYERNLSTVYDMLVQLAAQRNSFPELESLVIDDPSDPAASPWTLFSSEQDNIKKNFVSGLNTRLNKFENPAFKDIFRHNDIDMSLAGKEKCAYYVIFDEKNDTYKFVLNMFFSCFITTLFNEAKNNPNMTGRLDIPVFFILDEAASIGQLPDFVKVLNNSRKYGMAFAYIVQSYGFLEAVFEDRNMAQAIWAACDNTLAIGTNDADTANELSVRAGEATIKSESIRKNEAAYFHPSAGMMHMVGMQDSQRQLMTLNEIMTEESAIIFPRQKNIFIANKYAYTNHKFADFVDKTENRELPKDHIPKRANLPEKAYHYGLAALKDQSLTRSSGGQGECTVSYGANPDYDAPPITRSSNKKSSRFK